MECNVKYAAIGAITALMISALYLGHNGVILASAIAILGGIAGFEVRKGVEKKK